MTLATKNTKSHEKELLEALVGDEPCRSDSCLVTIVLLVAINAASEFGFCRLLYKSAI